VARGFLDCFHVSGFAGEGSTFIGGPTAHFRAQYKIQRAPTNCSVCFGRKPVLLPGHNRYLTGPDLTNYLTTLRPVVGPRADFDISFVTSDSSAQIGIGPRPPGQSYETTLFYSGYEILEWRGGLALPFRRAQTKKTSEHMKERFTIWWKGVPEIKSSLQS